MGPEAVPGHPSPGMHIWGWMSPAELDWLHGTAKTMQSIVEVGCLHGRSAYALATGCPGTVHCIDPFDDVDGWCEPSFRGNVGYLPNVHTIVGYSPAAGAEVKGDVDMVFIDGNHDTKSITDDIEHWLPRTTKLICGHDYCNADAGYPDVATVTNEMFGNRLYVPDDTSIWVVEL